MFLFDVLKKCKKELIFKIITSIIIQGLLLIIPVYWSNTINHVTNGIYDKAIDLTIITLTLTLLYYFWAYANQKTWYTFYNKLYLEYTNNIIKYSPSDVTIGQYTNVINNDIDIIGTFLGNLVTRIIQIIEFLVIYFYFLSIDKYIFFATLITSIIMIILIFYFGNKIEVVNKTRKDNLDIKTMNIHNIYDILKKNNKLEDDSFIKSTIKYLKSNAKFNVLAMGIIYIVLSFIELCRYGIIVYSIYLVSIGNMEIGTILLIYSYYAKIITNFEVLGTINAEYQSVKVSVNRLNSLHTEIE